MTSVFRSLTPSALAIAVLAGCAPGDSLEAQLAAPSESTAAVTDTPLTSSTAEAISSAFRAAAERADRFGVSDATGVVIRDVRPLSPAANAGLRKGQLVRSINGSPIRDVADVRRMAGDVEPGDAVSVRVTDRELGDTIVNYRAR